jgi:undecaprenyl-phosphate galactose phosphotransferase
MSAELQRIAAGRDRAGTVNAATVLPVLDIAVMVACFALAGTINWSYRNITDERLLILLLLTTAAVVAFKYLGHYDRRRLFWQEVGDVAVVSVAGLLLDAAFLYLAKVNFSRVWVATSWASVAVAVPLARRGVKAWLSRRGSWRRPTIIVGTGPLARETAKAYQQDSYLGYEVVAFVDPSATGKHDAPASIEVGGRRVPVLRGFREMTGHDAGGRSAHLIVALDADDLSAHEDLLERLCLGPRSIDIISPLRGLPISNTTLTHFFSHEVLAMRIHNNLARPWARFAKRAFDVGLCSLGLVLVAPLMLGIAALLALEGGPILFAHRRIGRGGRPFYCYKFRTMVPNAQEVLEDLLARDPQARAEWERDRKLRADPRVTRLGHWLRRLSFDELPQLFNILRGDMSLVGPRPVVEEELERYGPARIYYEMVRPGLTGLWQISGRNDLDYERRVALDTWYVRNWTLWYDILILFRTLVVVPARAGAY